MSEWYAFWDAADYFVETDAFQEAKRWFFLVVMMVVVLAHLAMEVLWRKKD